MMFSDQEEENFNISLSKFESMLKSNKILFFDSEEFENIVLHYLDDGKINLSKKALKLGLEQHPDSIGLMLVKVELLVFENKFEQGFEIVRRLKKLDPNNEEVYIQEANLYSKKGLHTQAIKSLDTALKHTDNEADVYSLMAMEYLYMDELSSAKHFFAKCLKLDPEDQSSLYNVVHCYDFLQQPQEAVNFLEKFIDDNPYNESAWYHLGRKYAELHDYQKAVRAFDFAYVIDDNFIGALIEIGRVYEEIKQYDKAILVYNEALEIDNESAFIYWKIGRCNELQNKHGEAEINYLTSLKHDILFDKSWLSVIDLYIKIGNLDKAKMYVEEAMELDDDNPYYWKKLRDISIDRNDKIEAYKACEKLANYDNVFMQVIDWLVKADVLVWAKDDLNAASDLLLWTEEKYQSNSEIDYRLAGIYFELGENEKAVYRLQNAMMSDFHKGIDTLQKIYPNVWKRADVQQYITNYEKRMND